MKHFVITVGCEFGSGGPEIGKMLAKSLGIEYYDRDLVDKVVEKIGVEKHLVEEADNKNFVPYGIETSLGTRYANLSNKVIYTQFDVIRKMAKTSCVIIGRCADYALAENPNRLSLFISAPLEDRIARVAKRQKVTPEEAKSLIQKTDKRRASYCEYYASKKWGAVDGYDFCLNSSSLGLGGTVELIRSMVDQKEHPIPSPTEEDPTLKEV